uniref:Uncharacterized protein n=1 Tax=Klebsiella pneumoniae TaxID=573 RepID=A0A2H5BR44_KLEPN|nr:hypothetical protein [Klebsiella pneumoniae]
MLSLAGLLANFFQAVCDFIYFIHTANLYQLNTSDKQHIIS